MPHWRSWSEPAAETHGRLQATGRCPFPIDERIVKYVVRQVRRSLGSNPAEQFTRENLKKLWRKRGLVP